MLHLFMSIAFSYRLKYFNKGANNSKVFLLYSKIMLISDFGLNATLIKMFV